MKKICSSTIFLSVLLLTATSVLHAQVTEDMDEYQFKGKVKKVTDEKIYGSDLSKTPTTRYIYTSDMRKHEALCEMWGNDEGTFKLDGTRKYNYDAAGKLIKWKNRLILEQTLTTNTVSYNKLGKVDRKVLYDSTQSLNLTTIYKYNAKGRETEQEELIDGAPQKKTTSRYDNDGRVIEMATTTWENKLGKVTYTYDNKGHKTEIQACGGGDSPSCQTTTYKYDAAGNVAEETRYNDGTAANKRKTTYTYDKTGNWVKMVVDEFYGYTVVRTIEYY